MNIAFGQHRICEVSFLRFIFILCECLTVSAVCACLIVQRPEEGAISPGAGIIEGSELQVR